MRLGKHRPVRAPVSCYSMTKQPTPYCISLTIALSGWQVARSSTHSLLKFPAYSSRAISMADAAPLKRRCVGVACENEAGTLQCPNCLKLGKERYFCSQDCFKRSWVSIWCSQKYREGTDPFRLSIKPLISFNVTSSARLHLWRFY